MTDQRQSQNPGAIARLGLAGQAFYDIFTGRQNGPGVPLAPSSSPKEQAGPPRNWQTRTSSNLMLTPRSEDNSLAPFKYLRNLAQNCAIANICATTRIREIQGWNFRISAKNPNDQKSLQNDCDATKDWFDKMDGRNSFATNIGKMLYDTITIDATALFKERDYGGNLTRLIPIDGSTFKPILDDSMDVVAYQQILSGMVASEWLPDIDLLYEVINPRTYSPYGHSALETVLVQIKTLLRKQDWDFAHFDSSSIPRLFVGSPEGWTPDQFGQFVSDLNTSLSGNEYALEQIVGIPGDVTKTVKEIKPWTYDEKLDDFMIRLVCAAFQMPPAELGMTAQLHQTGSKHQAGVNMSAGQVPLLQFLKRTFDPIISDEFGYYPLECKFVDDQEMDAMSFMQRAQGMAIYAGMGAVSPQEVRSNELPAYDENDGSSAPGAPGDGSVPAPDNQVKVDETGQPQNAQTPLTPPPMPVTPKLETPKPLNNMQIQGLVHANGNSKH